MDSCSGRGLLGIVGRTRSSVSGDGSGWVLEGIGRSLPCSYLDPVSCSVYIYGPQSSMTFGICYRGRRSLISILPCGVSLSVCGTWDHMSGVKPKLKTRPEANLDLNSQPFPLINPILRMNQELKPTVSDNGNFIPETRVRKTLLRTVIRGVVTVEVFR